MSWPPTCEIEGCENPRARDAWISVEGTPLIVCEQHYAELQGVKLVPTTAPASTYMPKLKRGRGRPRKAHAVEERKVVKGITYARCRCDWSGELADYKQHESEFAGQLEVIPDG